MPKWQSWLIVHFSKTPSVSSGGSIPPLCTRTSKSAEPNVAETSVNSSSQLPSVMVSKATSAPSLGSQTHIFLLVGTQDQTEVMDSNYALHLGG